MIIILYTIILLSKGEFGLFFLSQNKMIMIFHTMILVSCKMHVICVQTTYILIQRIILWLSITLFTIITGKKELLGRKVFFLFNFAQIFSKIAVLIFFHYYLQVIQNKYLWKTLIGLHQNMFQKLSNDIETNFRPNLPHGIKVFVLFELMPIQFWNTCGKKAQWAKFLLKKVQYYFAFIFKFKEPQPINFILGFSKSEI